jgi:hypothetical protein
MPTSTTVAPLQPPAGHPRPRSRRSIPPSERFREDTTEPERMDAVAADSKRPSPASVGERVRCLLRCSLFGSSRCARCSVPDHRGAPVCPRCGSRLYYLGIEGDRGAPFASLWSASSPHTGCLLPLFPRYQQQKCLDGFANIRPSVLSEVHRGRRDARGEKSGPRRRWD